MSQLSQDELNEIWRKQKEWELDRREKFRNALLMTPPPVPDKYVGLLVKLPDADFRDIMLDHPAYDLSEKRATYRTSFAIMELCYRDLMAVLDDFAAKATDDDNDLIGPLGKDTLKAIELRIQKEVFAITGAAHALVDHSRLETDTITFPDRDKKIAECFGSDGLNNFILKLRNLLHHVHSVEAGWSVRYGFRDGTRRASFRFNKENLLRVVSRHYSGKKRAELEAFIKLWPEDISLRGLFIEYRMLCAWVDLLNQSRIIVTRPRAIDPLRDRPFLQQVLPARLHERRRVVHVAALPLLKVFGFQHHRHAVVDFRHELIGLGDDHGAGAYPLACLRVVPNVFDSGDRHDVAVAPSEIVRLFATRRGVPFVIAGDRHEAASFLERIPEEGLRLHRLCPSIEGGEAQLLERLRPPAGNDPPAHRHECPFAVAHYDHVHLRGRTDIVARLKVRLWDDEQAIVSVDFRPGVFPREAPAHWPALAVLAHLFIDFFDAAIQNTGNLKGDLSALYPFAQDAQIHLNPGVAFVRLNSDGELARLIEHFGPCGFVGRRHILDHADGEVIQKCAQEIDGAGRKVLFGAVDQIIQHGFDELYSGVIHGRHPHG